MKTKQNVETITPFEKANLKPKLKSLRPMRSMVAVRSLKPKTAATAFIQTEATAKN